MSGWPLHRLDALHEYLSTVLASGRLHHALLLTGRPGVGKRSIAGWIARSLLCAQGPRPGGCGECGACHRVAAMVHPDVHVVARPAGRTRVPVEALRTMNEELQRGALEGRGRVAILAGVEDLNVEGQNTLLKTLEEPSPRTWLILTSTKPEALLPTVRSRVHRVAVPPLGREQVASFVAREAGIDAVAATRVAALADGSIGRARQVLAEGPEAWVRLCAPLLEATDVHGAEWVRKLLAGAQAGEEGARQAKQERATRVLETCVSLLRERGHAGDGSAWEAIESVLEARADLALGLGAEIVLEDLFGRLAHVRSPRTAHDG